MENNTEIYILQSKIEGLQAENNKLNHQVLNLKKLIKHVFEGKELPKNIKNIIDF